MVVGICFFLLGSCILSSKRLCASFFVFAFFFILPHLNLSFSAAIYFSASQVVCWNKQQTTLVIFPSYCQQHCIVHNKPYFFNRSFTVTRSVTSNITGDADSASVRVPADIEKTIGGDKQCGGRSASVIQTHTIHCPCPCFYPGPSQ